MALPLRVKFRTWIEASRLDDASISPGVGYRIETLGAS